MVDMSKLYESDPKPKIPKEPSSPRIQKVEKESKSIPSEVKIRLQILRKHLSNLKMNGKTGIISDIDEILALL